jgi:hypothetical protein
MKEALISPVRRVLSTCTGLCVIYAQKKGIFNKISS